LFQHISKTVILVNFTINREHIAKNLCVKKEEPKSCCKGSCHLKTKLEEDGKRDESTPGSSGKQKFEKSEYCLSTLTLKFDERSIKNNFSSFSSKTFAGYSSIVFRPPSC
jgi:hypothetical protein